jgi:hypothetical protein
MVSEMGLLTKDENRHTIPQIPLYPLRFEPISVSVVGRTAFGGPAHRPSNDGTRKNQ